MKAYNSAAPLLSLLYPPATIQSPLLRSFSLQAPMHCAVGMYS